AWCWFRIPHPALLLVSALCLSWLNAQQYGHKPLPLITLLPQRYTEGEIRQLISTLIERYSQSMNSGGHELPLLERVGTRMKRAKARHKPCSLKELEVTVSELGLGYKSDETVLFRYCSGTCDSAVRNYDLSLKNVRSMRKIKKEKVRARPCCRPLSYDDDVSFLDTGNRYYTVNEVSAKECGCV
uniref:Neurturin n=1 Tax=Varanus komodoensis TaxID=61221 RepID=A0A8D2JJZ3_VARKO